MKKSYLKPLLLVGCLLAVTCVAMGYSKKKGIGSPHVFHSKSGIVTLSGDLTQDKILWGGDGIVPFSLTLTADDLLDLRKEDSQHVDMVIVLDRSGSMEGQKIKDAKKAVLNLLSNLSPGDRFALVTYADHVQRHTSLVSMTNGNRERIQSILKGISPGGSTNLGGGLQEGITVLSRASKTGNVGKVILISDGLANRGVTNPASLGTMASTAVNKEFGVSTVGVGQDFNEYLLTTIADRGTGNYYYLENPVSFAEVFQKEFKFAKAAAATSVEVRVPVSDHVSLVSAAGYPIEVKDNEAIFRPGNLLSGQTRKLFLTFQVPTHEEGSFAINGISTRYLFDGKAYTVTLDMPFQVACVKEQEEVFASIDKDEWERKVLQDDFNKLREDVAAEVKKGNEKEALGRIHQYYQDQQAVNSVVKSPAVRQNLERDLTGLRATVSDAFQGRPEEVEVKKKEASKSLQYEGYKGRRSKTQ
jgi:Ca-activated chloride channel family protein